MKKINLQCAIGKTGYGITSLNILKSLSKIEDLSMSLFPIGENIQLNSDDEKSIIQQSMNNAEQFDCTSPSLKIWHQFDLASRIGSGRYYSFPFFEVDKITPREQVHLNSCGGGIFVASKWAKQVLLANNIFRNITVAPLAVDTNIFKHVPRIKITNDNYVFFHIGKWEHRKSQDFLLKCFDAAFDINDKVELRLLPHNPFLNEQETKYWLDMVDSCKLKSKIKIYNRLPTQYHLAEFIFAGDCGVFLSRAEGWNNEILECMAMNKPIITTMYSAHTEYCTRDNAFLVDIDQLEVANDNKWFNGYGNWAKLGDSQLEQTVSHMRYVYNNHITTNSVGLQTASEYSWDKTAKIIYNTIFPHGSKSYANSKKKTKRR